MNKHRVFSVDWKSMSVKVIADFDTAQEAAVRWHKELDKKKDGAITTHIAQLSDHAATANAQFERKKT